MTELSAHTKFMFAVAQIMREAVNERLAAEAMVIQVLSSISAEDALRAIDNVRADIARHAKQEQQS